MALYNKYRPKNLDEVCGQEAVKTVLKNQILAGKCLHSYLFVGNAGVGKTTIARIFAAMVNCSTGESVNPPADDKIVASILSGKSHSDVMEIDAASNNGVDYMRELRNGAAYPPLELRKKVFIIDECHMLSRSSWNSLLKIIEEPPPWVMFVFCTTEVESVPDTILTRCLKLTMTNVSDQDCKTHLKKICCMEGLSINDDALRMLSLTSQGSMRMALMRLDEIVIKNPGKPIDADMVAAAAGVPSRSSVRDYVNSVLSGKFADALVSSSQIIGTGAHAKTFISEVSFYCHNLLLAAASGYMESVGYTEAEINDVKATRKTLSDEVVDFRVVVRAWLKALQQYSDMTVFNVQPQFLVDVTWVELWSIYKSVPRKPQAATA